jgi:hypothetical protein
MNRRPLVFRFFVVLVVLAICVRSGYGQTLKARLDGDQVHLDSPDLHFISADARQVLHDGVTVTYSFRISISASKYSVPAVSITYHCVFSYDIWEERYKVSRSEPGARSASHLNEDAAQKLCVESLTIPTASLTPDSAFWISLEYRMEDRQVSSSGEDQRTWLGAVVEIFSQRKEKPQLTGMLQGGPFRLSELRRR